MTVTQERTRYQIANDLTTIFVAMNMCGMAVPEFDYGTMKVDCPFDNERAFRVYGESNSAYCFACSKKYTPVSLIAEHRGVSIEEAATILIEKAEREGRWRPPTPEGRWEALVNQPFVFDRASEAEALKLFCARIDKNWGSTQFEPRIAVRLTRCLEALEKVGSTDDLNQWRTITRSAMKKALNPEGESRG